MRVACVLPLSPSDFRNKGVIDNIHISGLLCVAGYLKLHQFEVEVFDYLANEGTDQKYLDQKLVNFSPQVIIVCAMFCLEDLQMLLAHLPQLALKPTIICIGTGAVDYQMCLNRTPLVDYAIPVHPEEVLLDILQALSGNQDIQDITGIAHWVDGHIHFIPRTFQSLDSILDGQDVRQFISAQDPTMAYIWGSRGCWYHRCIFCTIGVASRLCKGNGWISREPGKIVEDMKKLNALGVRRFHFMDSEFIGPGLHGQRRAQDFARKLLKVSLGIEFYIDIRVGSIEYETMELLKAAGLVSVFIGVESYSQTMLDRLCKGQTIQEIQNGISILRKLKIPFRTGSFLADPNSSLLDIKESFDQILKFRLFDGIRVAGSGCIFHEMHLHAGTAIYEQFVASCENGDQLKSEIPCKCSDKNVTTFVTEVGNFRKEIMKRYNWNLENFRDLTWKTQYNYALRILSYNGIRKILDIGLSNVGHDQKSGQYKEILSELLRVHDQHWLCDVFAD